MPTSDAIAAVLEAGLVPRWPFLAPDGRVGGFVAAAAWPDPGGVARPGEGLWTGQPGGSLRMVDGEIPSVAPVLDSAGRRLLQARHDELSSRISVLRLDLPDAEPAPLTDIPGFVQQLAWDERAGRVLAVVAEPGADTASLNSGKRSARSRSGVELDGGNLATQRIWSVELASGRSIELGPRQGCVWQLAPAPDGSLLVICSAEPGEDAWYHSWVGRFDATSGRLEPLYRPQWQISDLVVESASGRAAFIEGWASDRGLVAGEIVVLAPDGQVERRIGDLDVDATYLHWGTSGRLFVAGWRNLSVAWGWVGDQGVRELRSEPFALMSSRWRPGLALSADGKVAIACRSSEEMAPEVAVFEAGQGWNTWSAPNRQGAPEMEVVEGAWEGAGGEEIQGILLLPEVSAARNGAAAGALVVMIHGGPSIAWHHGFDLGGANRLVSEGFSVLLPNPRGGAGRGSGFSRANHGDPGGAELEDVLSGARWALRTGRIPAGRPSLMGWSYGGYLSAFAAATCAEVGAAVVGAGMSDLVSCRHTCNNPAFYDIVLGGPPTDPRVARLYIERSAAHRLGPGTAPTLILHGADDRCVPVAQAYELFGALGSVSAEVEMAIYPGEGHQFNDKEHFLDQWARTVRWLARHAEAAARV